MVKKSDTSLFYVDNFDEGWRADISADKAPPGSLVVANNIRYIPGGGFTLRKGAEEVFELDTAYRIEQFGKCVEHKVLFTKSGTKIFQTKSEDETPYTIGWVGSAGHRGKFREYNSEMKYTNGEDIYLSITVGRVNTQFTQASTTILMEPGNADLFRRPKTGTYTADAGTDTITATAHGLVNGDRVAFYSSGTLPAGTSENTEYFVRNVAANTFQISTTPAGAILNITSTGSGTHTFTDGILYCKGLMIVYTKKKSQTFTADAGTNTITAAEHNLENGSIIELTNSGGALPAGLSVSTSYFVIDATTDTFKLSATDGGAEIDITGAGTGTHTFDAIKGGDTFTGCRIQSGTYEAGSIVTQTLDIPDAPKGTVLESVFEKMVVGGGKFSGHAMHYSVTANVDEPFNIDDFSSSGADVELFGKYGSVTAMQVLLHKMYVAKQKGFEAWTGIDADGIPVREPYDNSYGVVNHDCLIEMGNRLALFTDTRRIKTIEPDNTGANPEPIINPYFDKKIPRALARLDIDQDRARMGYNERDELLRVTCEENDFLQTIILDTETEGFSLDTGYFPACWVEWNGSMYYGDANEAKVYKTETGYSDGPSTPAMLVVTPIHFVGDRRRKVPVQHIMLTGLIKRMTEATVEVWVDGELLRTVTLDGSASYVSASVFRPLGRDSVGYAPIGHSGGDPTEDDGYEFAVPIDVNSECRYIQLKFKCQGTGYGFQVDSYEGVRTEAGASMDTQIDAI